LLKSAAAVQRGNHRQVQPDRLQQCDSDRHPAGITAFLLGAVQKIGMLAR